MKFGGDVLRRFVGKCAGKTGRKPLEFVIVGCKFETFLTMADESTNWERITNKSTKFNDS
jgi:hypothetical protein